MTPEDLRAAIPATDDAVYLNTGASGPSPRSVTEATKGAVDEHERSHADSDPYEYAFGAYEETREAVAGFVGAAPEEIALTNSTADGISRVAAAMDWEPGDVVVRTDLEHPAGILPWRHLAETHGVEVRTVACEGGRLPLDAVKEATRDAKLFAFSALSWNYGTRLPVAEAVDIARDNGARTLVDAVQVPGHVPVDYGEWGADFVAAAGHKWLLGPWGAGFLYVRDGAAAALDPAAVGYRGVVEPNADEGYEFHPGARRFEVGTVSPAPYAGLREAIDVMASVGPDAVRDRIEGLTERLKSGIDDERLLSPREFESGLVTLSDDDPAGTVERLRDEGIVVRSIPDPASLRVSLHAFNTADDVDAFLDAFEA
ncbi:aminotransferase class V-fold PLP-dependent enzyme [Halostella litorea]|uniref:aminotransferase class V-fold PLP-dependent enzyme n=1 Tax=Halostella litorea TaxID=2528831 RepID=UPI0010920FC3|nr:aminotransferase class V-fold PLP-dependent enzyme [Halostella litorea]